MGGTHHRNLRCSWPIMLAVGSALFAATSALNSLSDTSSLYTDFNPLTGTCLLTAARGALMGDKFYIWGGFFWFMANDTTFFAERAPNTLLRVLDTTKPFKTTEANSLPMTFEVPPDAIPEFQVGSLWAYNSSLWRHAGSPLEMIGRKDWPGYNTWEPEAVYDLIQYDTVSQVWTEDRRTAEKTPAKGPMMMIDLGFGVVVESLAKAFLIGGRNATNRTTYDPGPLLPGMVTFDFQRREWEQLASPWSQWEYGLAEHVAVEDPGYMFAFAGWERENNELSQIEIYDLSSKVWLPTQTATAADPSFGLPLPREFACSVIARAKDGSSYNIYVFGGWNRNFGYFNDVWVLSIPSFRWFLVSTGDVGDVQKLSLMSCALVGGGNKMLIYGGTTPEVADNRGALSSDCDKHPSGTYVFNINSLTWEDSYDPNGLGYEVPKDIYNVIGGGSHGGATLLPEAGFASSSMEEKFMKLINKVDEATSNGTDSASSEPDDSDVSATPTPRDPLQAGAIAGIAIGSAMGLSLLGFGMFWLIRRRKTTTPTLHEYVTTTELVAGQLEPRELLATYTYPPQELHGYTPPELDASGYSGGTYSGYRPELPGADLDSLAKDQQEDMRCPKGPGTL